MTIHEATPTLEQPISEEFMQQERSPAEQIGLEDGVFNVIRSDGSKDIGWSVHQLQLGPDGKPQAAQIIKPGERPDEVLLKTVSVEKLKNWQIVPEAQAEGDKNRHVLWELGANALKAANIMVSPESRTRDKRLEAVFKPILSEAEMPAAEPEASYSYLFEKNEAAYQKKQEQQMVKERLRDQEKHKYSVVTEQSRDRAIQRLDSARRADIGIDEIIAKYQRELDISDPKDVVDMIRKNADVRYDLGTYLLKEKLPRRMHMMPERIARNTQKNPHHRGYQQVGALSSQEYATLIALSMIDGSYQEPGAGDPIYRDSAGTPIQGQHRAAAEELLT